MNTYRRAYAGMHNKNKHFNRFRSLFLVNIIINNKTKF